MTQIDKIAIISFVIFTGTQVYAKTAIDVSVRLAENICVYVNEFKKSGTYQGELKANKLDDGGPSSCVVWQWTKCDHNHDHPCATWQKAPCAKKREEKTGKTRMGGKFCDTYQCGWTLDELHINWGYNPEHVRNHEAEVPPKDQIFDSFATLDFPEENNAL